MPDMPSRPCRRAGCPELTTDGLCRAHKAAAHKRYDQDQRDPDGKRFLDSTVWKNLRRWKIAQNPACEHCIAEGGMSLAIQVDHIEPRDKRPDLAMVASNLQSLCLYHHGTKTAKENRSKGFGNKPQ